MHLQCKISLVLYRQCLLSAMQFKSRGGKDLRISYPCVVLNVMVAKHNTNEQYQTLVDAAAKRYETSSRMSIEFEVDGPYKVPCFPPSEPAGRLLAGQSPECPCS